MARTYSHTKPYMLIHSILSKALIDKAIVYAVLGNLVSLILGPVTALLIASQFSPELQGYYYAFGSLSIFQFLVELGLGQAIIQFASHEWAHLTLDKKRRITGDPNSLSRLVSLARQALKWYAVIAVIVTVVLCIVGLEFFSGAPASDIQWKRPWVMLCVGIGVNLLMMPIFYLLQGCNQVSQFWFFRLIQQLVNGLAMWALILTGAKLWVSPISSYVCLLWSVIFLFSKYSCFIHSIFFSPLTESTVNWRNEVWPVQWRIGISWISTNFGPQLFVPILFSVGGPVVAGQMGMTLTLMNVLVATSSNWVVTKAPSFGVLIAQRRFLDLDRLFFRSFTASCLVACSGAFMAWALIVLFNISQVPIASRILPPLPAALFLLSGILSSVTINLATYLRAHKQDPLAGILLTSCAAVIILGFTLALRHVAMGVALSYFSVLVFFQIPATVIIFQRRRFAWHHAQLVP